MERLSELQIWLYLGPLALIWVSYLATRLRRGRKARKMLKEMISAGLTEPASLHPVINPNKCLGCAACVPACPESKHDVLGIIRGKSVLTNPTACIGHGACKTACPLDAITLVFGTATRGLDIPTLSPEFETNVPGIYIAGELGGMGLIRNAIEQGRQAMEAIHKNIGKGKEGLLDVVVVGAGPSGISASLSAMSHNMNLVTVEQESFGGTVAHFPRGKLVMTAPVELPLAGKMKFTETTKEKLLAFWEDVAKRTGLKINYGEQVLGVEANANGFIVTTSDNKYHTRAVLLAIGRRGSPRKLDVPGEELPKVVYRMIDPEQYRGQPVLVVGGGDSALEAATSIAELPGDGSVILSYRSDSFSRAREKNRKRVAAAEASGRLTVMLSSNVRHFTPDTVTIEQHGKETELANDAAIVCAGGVLPTPFLKQIGIEVETKYGTA